MVSLSRCAARSGGFAPTVVVQTDKIREPRVRSFLVMPLTSRLHLQGLSGNVRLEPRDTRLGKPSVADVYDVQKVLRSDFLERSRALAAVPLGLISEGLRLALDL